MIGQHTPSPLLHQSWSTGWNINSSMGPPRGIDLTTHHTMSRCSSTVITESCALYSARTKHSSWCPGHNMLAVVKFSHVFTNVSTANTSMTLNIHVVAQCKDNLKYKTQKYFNCVKFHCHNKYMNLEIYFNNTPVTSLTHKCCCFGVFFLQ